MPARNASRTVALALESIRVQTLLDWELVAVDDGSTDTTPTLLQSAACGDRRIRVLSQAPLGIAEALQRGCAAARSPFIARMDADDWMHPERLLRQCRFLEEHAHIGVVSCSVCHGGNRATQRGYAEYIAWVNSVVQPEEISLCRFVESPVAHPSVMFRRALLDAHGGYASGDFPEDYELWLRWMDAGVEFGKIDAVMLTWNDLPGRLSRIDQRYRPEAFYRMKCLYLARWLKKEVGSHREIWLWGSGRITRRRFRALEQHGITIRGFIDVDVKKIGRSRDRRPVVGPSDLPAKERAFVLVGVGSRGAREFISGELRRAGRAEGIDYLLVA
jgi:glycosyltransferase involved in cell wall biosynthesis